MTFLPVLALPVVNQSRSFFQCRVGERLLDRINNEELVERGTFPAAIARRKTRLINSQRNLQFRCVILCLCRIFLFYIKSDLSCFVFHILIFSSSVRRWIARATRCYTGRGHDGVSLLRQQVIIIMPYLTDEKIQVVDAKSAVAPPLFSDNYQYRGPILRTYVEYVVHIK